MIQGARPGLLLRIVTLACVLLTPPAGYATPVFIEASGAIGRGIAEMRGAECMIILPQHVAGDMKEVTVYSVNGARGKALYVKKIGEREDDLALFRSDTNAEAICNNTEAAMFKAMPGTVLFIREQSGAFRTEAVEILRRTQRSLALSFVRERAREAQGLSGSVVYENGRPAGVLLEVGIADDRPALARPVDYVAALEGSWVLGQSADVSRIRDALQILQTVMQTRPPGDMGQVAAVEELVRNGSALAGTDFRGIGLGSAMLDHGDFSNARMQAVKLANASLKAANITAARFDFADLKNVNAVSADARETRFYYAVADAGDFTSLKGPNSNWTAASARHASFRDADLSGASFLFADLTGADFTGADLRQTVFIGAILDQARFDRAQLERTDFTAASSDLQAFDAVQRDGICATLADRGTRISLVRTVPSTRFQSGMEFDELVQDSLYLPVSIDRLPRCARRDLRPAGFPPVDEFEHGGEHTETVTVYFRMDYESDPYDRIGLRSRFRERVRDQVARVQQALSNARFLQIESRRARELEAALRARLGKTGFAGKFSLNDHETIQLLRLRHAPASLPDEQWTWMARSRLEQESRERASPPGAADTGRWEAFFPADVYARELNTRHIDLFRQWSVNRAKAMPATVYVRLNLPGRARQSLQTATRSAATEASIQPFDAVDKSRLRGLPEGAIADQDRLASVYSDSSMLVMLEKPADAYRLELDAKEMLLLRDARQLELEARIIDARFLERETRPTDRPVAVIRVEPLAIAATARNGTSHAFGL